MPREGDQNASRAAEVVARRSYGRLVAFLAARTGDVPRPRTRWPTPSPPPSPIGPQRGVPRNPEAWLMAVARRRSIDAARRRRNSDTAAEHVRLLAEELADAAARITRSRTTALV